MLQLLSTDFFLYAAIAGVSLAIIAGPLGSFIVWRRMSYFGDTLAHAALLGIAIGLVSGSSIQLSIILSSVVLGLLLALLDKKTDLSSDAILGILAHSALAFGVVFLALTDSVRVDLESYLFGSMLTITTTDLIWIVGIGVVVLASVIYFWNDLLSVSVHRELAEIDGANVDRLNLLLIMLIALTIAVSMKIVGVLLITSLLIIPPATSRAFAKTPEKMAFFASFLGVLAIIGGLLLAFQLDTPVGPTVVVIATIIFAGSQFLQPKT